MKKEFGIRIKEIRKNMNMNEEEFANRLGITILFLESVENGNEYLSIEKLKILCDISGLTSDYILFGKKSPDIEITKEMLETFTEEELRIGCATLKKLAHMINLD